jgi:hypothetical protein
LLNIKRIVPHRSTYFQIGDAALLRAPLGERFYGDAGMYRNFVGGQKVAEFISH